LDHRLRLAYRETATLNLAPGVAQSTTLTAAVSAPAATSTVNVHGTSGSISHSATLLSQYSGADDQCVGCDHLSLQCVAGRATPKETILTQAQCELGSVRQDRFDAVDGKVDAQPLYLANVAIGGQLRNVLYVAPNMTSVYAFRCRQRRSDMEDFILGSGETTSDDPRLLPDHP